MANRKQMEWILGVLISLSPSLRYFRYCTVEKMRNEMGERYV
ncbi:hypothetical protein JOD24_002468 [Kroppenstedtia sanguinis]